MSSHGLVSDSAGGEEPFSAPGKGDSWTVSSEEMNGNGNAEPDLIGSSDDLAFKYPLCVLVTEK